MKRAEFVAAARREFLAHVVYYNKEDSGLGARFSAAVEDAMARALAYPLAGSPAPRNTRRVYVRDFPYSVVYRPNADGITVFAVAHDSRRPNYWSLRVQDREGEYRSSEAVNDLIRKAREIDGIRARSIQAEQSGFTRLTRDQIRAEIREEMRRNGELQD